MENASKALIIAGAILVSILLIGIGVTLINAVNGVVGTGRDTVSAQEVQAFNANFEKYAGKGQSGANVKTLISLIISSNQTNTNGRKVAVNTVASILNDATMIANGSTTAANLGKVSNAIVSTSKYNVNLTYGTTGIITKITITK